MVFFSVPSDKERKDAWVAEIEKFQEFDHYVSKFYLCESHFAEGTITKTGRRAILQRNALPTIFPSV